MVKSIVLLCEGVGYGIRVAGKKREDGKDGVLCQLVVVGTTNRGSLPALAETGTIWVSAAPRLRWKNASGCQFTWSTLTRLGRVSKDT